jgi:hemoglobin
MREITNKDDINLLVNTFYTAIREDELLGPIFNSHIETDAWPAHLDKLTNFWETALFGIPSFKGNPTGAHRKVDANLNHSISPEHFNQWLGLWHKTIDSLFEGHVANRAKEASIRMAQGQFHAISSFR